MEIRAGHVTIASAMAIMLGHVGMLPWIFFVADRTLAAEKLDIALLIGPMTVTYFLTIMRFSFDKRHISLIEHSSPVNFLFVFSAFFSVAPFLISLYVSILLYENHIIDDFEDLKVGIGVIELFFGGAFALFAQTVFGETHSQ